MFHQKWDSGHVSPHGKGRFEPNFSVGTPNFFLADFDQPEVWRILAGNFREFSGCVSFALFGNYAFTPLVITFHKNEIFKFLIEAHAGLVLENAEF